MKVNSIPWHRLWMLFAQAVAIGAGLLVAWRAFGPATPPSAPAAAARREVVTVHETSGSSSLASTLLGRRDTGYRVAARKAAASVVNVYSRSAPKRRGRRANDSLSLGSGVIVAAKGYILTNDHVVEGASEFSVTLPNGKTVDAKLLGRDPDTDLAVLKVEATDLQPITFADADSVQVGDIVLAVGDPFAVGQTVTHGIVSATGRNRLGINTFENFIQTDAAINPGNSGGALVDLDGNLVGINAAIYSESGGFQGIGFAIPVSLARKVMDQIIAHGRVDRGWLGVSASDVERSDPGSSAGAVIKKIERGSPGEKAGMRVGDTVIALNGKSIADATALINETAMLAPGSQAEYKVIRQGETMALEAELGRRLGPAAKRR
ncbi:MAG: trypsin-like peptidase domain-containing protein [Proteobacteria bacterium]|nr:trypsin-like peptidase domain-containing protein [Pseudomonadota bacterium]